MAHRIDSATATIRERLEQEEKERLSSLAQLAIESKGRDRQEAESPLRTCYMRDRDRILHSKAFRRLKHKTQVFLAPTGDHYRTRLTHTLEVTGIARTIARALALNEDLTEAIALGHDLGHTPFGHIGEEAITQAFHNHGYENTFEHNLQSVRIVERVEYEGKGLNLSFETKDGIRNHTGPVDPATQEGKIVKIVDRIAYINHDIDDAVRAGILKAAELPQEIVSLLGEYSAQRINTLVDDLIRESERKSDITLSETISNAMKDIRAFMFQKVYHGSPAKSENEKAIRVITELFDFFLNHLDQLPPEFRPLTEEKDERIEKVCDYIAGMTDRFALQTYEKHFLPQVWSH